MLLPDSGPVWRYQRAPRLKVLLSSLACSAKLGSESLVGFRMAQGLSEEFEVEVVTSALMAPPAGVTTHRVGARFDDPNDVGPAQLLRFELAQQRLVRRLFRGRAFDLVHRVTPSGHKDSLLRVPAVPLVLGPVLGSDAPPPSFEAIFRPRMPRSLSPKAFARRIGNGVARRAFERFSTLDLLLERAAAILVGTEVTRRRLPVHLHPRCRLVTYAGVEHERFTPPAARRSTKVAQLLFVGRLVPYKGVELLLRAAAVAKNRCRCELRIVGGGDPSYRRYCRRLAADLKLDETVKFVTHVPRESLVEMYRAADVFCMPSIETYGIAILEAMSCGCAVLVADYNGPGEIVVSGTGLKVPLETPEQFIEEYARRIVELVDDQRLRGALGQAAREHVARRHDWKQIESSWLEVYDEVLSARGCPALA